MKEIKLKGVNEIIYEHEHKSGLKTFMWVNEKVKSCYMTLSVKYGSVHTEFKIDNKKYKVPNGLAHFLEHIKFNESEDYAAHDYFYKSGGDVNAFTTFKFTSYLVFTTVNLQDNLNHLIDFVFNPYFSKKIIQKEKGIIVEEAKMGSDDPYQYSYFLLLKNMFHEIKYKEFITGNPDEVKEISLEDIEVVFNNFYHPENMFLCLTGNFNPYEMAKIIDENMNQKSFLEYKEPVIIEKKEDCSVVKEYEEIELNVTTSKVRYGIKIPCSKFKNYSDLEIRMYISLLLNINFGSTSDLQEELLVKGLITSISATCDIYEDYVGIIISADTEYPKEVIKRIEDKINNLDINEKDFIRKKKANIATFILEFDDIETVNTRIQDNIIMYNDLLADLKIQYQNLSYDEFTDFANLINYDVKSILVVNPKKEE